MKPRLIVAGGGCADSAPSRKATGRSAWVISTAWGARITVHPPGRAPSSNDCAASPDSAASAAAVNTSANWRAQAGVS